MSVACPRCCVKSPGTCTWIVRPSSAGHWARPSPLISDYCYAVGLHTLLRQYASHLHLDAPTVNARTLGENIPDAPCWNHDVIRPLTDPIRLEAGIAVLRRNLSPDGAVIKPSAASP